MDVRGHKETHPLVAGGQQRRYSFTQTHESRPLLRLAVPALHHHLIPENSKSRRCYYRELYELSLLYLVISPWLMSATVYHSSETNCSEFTAFLISCHAQQQYSTVQSSCELSRTRQEVRALVWTSCIHSWSCCRSLNPRPSLGMGCHLQTKTDSHEFII